MALFGFKKKEEEKKEPAKKAEVKAAPKKEEKPKVEAKKIVPTISSGKDLSRVLIQPRVTEKATVKQTTENVYVFNVDPRANKKDVSDAVAHLFKVTPVKVNIAKVPSKKVSTRIRGRSGVKSGGKKAYVYLKEGDSISIV
ncbi:MAG: 50S ribosomal protein L23 [Candidatus Pacebacteria bacterium]|jgi:large subunit ribosomal protein L23|nr:50S ribosomal protein L23 [bacterium]MDP6527311.1 50S ribosomal protein L23 [Candidatus Paceibacterota bacterium]MDP6659411.1 50S ribosomal protein L23 [Candidatus Paceibacterota bacterium]